MKRLLGAAVLIALAVIFVPMLLPSGSPTGSKAVSLDIPPPPNHAMQTRVLQVGPEGADAGPDTAVVTSESNPGVIHSSHPATPQPPPAAATSAAPSQAIATATANGKADAEDTKVAAAETAATNTAASESAPAKPQPVAGGPGAAAGTTYVVNLGIYAKHANADKLVTAAKQHGFTATAMPTSFNGKSVLRVRVGPYSSRAGAEAAKLKLQSFEPVSAMTVETVAVNQKADAPASALPADEAGAWAVQVGAFSTQNSANMLRDQLRALGFDGYVDSVDTSKRKLWRVRAGPFTTRDAAQDSRARIAKKLKIKGIIVTQH